MFWDKWIPGKYLVNSTVCGIEVVFTANGYTLNYALLKNQNNKLNVIESGRCESFTQLPETLKKTKCPLVINFTGKGVINKKASYNSQEELHSAEFIHQHLPAINTDEFYFQIIAQDNGSCFIALLRKEQADSLIAEVNQNKFEIADVVIGQGVVTSITKLIAGYNQLNAGTSKVELLNGFIENIIPTEDLTTEEIKLGDLSIKSNYINAFSSAFSYLTLQNLYLKENNSLVNHKIKHTDKNKLKVAKYFFVGLAFTICLVNFLVFTNYYSKSNKLQSELDIYQDKYEQINELLSSYEKKKVLIEQTGLLEGNSLAKYSDKIASTLPQEVVLTDFYLNPEVKNTDTEDTLTAYQRNIILVKGNCNSSMIINEWVNVLKSQNFIKNVNLEKFLFSNEGNQPNFEIKIVTE